eukprot:TRINITY_DN102493_c0_g1_i1.p1 TRINITY_DN102493_c0_g1~~TRINITY_DN102493_c0_g1_i1.p1  ORF type:complete len:253 (+),score=44.93 TRINITY_DN102493_c0_g1_i1:84-842(+)
MRSQQDVGLRSFLSVLCCALFYLVAFHGSNSPVLNFLQMAPSSAPSLRASSPQRSGAKMPLQKVVDPSSTGTAGLLAAILGAAAAARAASRTRRFETGSNSFVTSPMTLSSNQLVAQVGDAENAASLVTQYGVCKRKRKSPSDRTWRDYKRSNKRMVNQSALYRFLVKPDGTIWKKSPGLRHLKQKKSGTRIRRLKKLVLIKPQEYKRVRKVLGIKHRPPKASEFIMREYDPALIKAGKGLWNNGTGSAMWT